jgi:hypothetical protein
MVHFIEKDKWNEQENIEKWRAIHHFNNNGDICFCGLYALFYECRHPAFTDIQHPCGNTMSECVPNRAIACYRRLVKVHVHNVIIIGICDHCEANGK